MLFNRDWKRIFTANLWLLLRPGLRGVDILVIPITYLQYQVKLSTEHLWRNRFSSSPRCSSSDPNCQSPSFISYTSGTLVFLLINMHFLIVVVSLRSVL